MKRVLAACMLVTATGTAVAAPPEDVCPNSRSETTTKETFSKDSNAAGWAFSRGSAREAINPKGGSPGAFVQNTFTTSAYPIASTDPSIPSAWVGDYRAMNVGSIGADFIVYRNNLNLFEERYVTVMLVNTNDTPEDPWDDCFVFYTGDETIPNPAITGKAFWQSYDFAIPSQNAGLPTPNRMDCTDGDCQYMSCPDLGVPCWGWSKDTLCETRADGNATWNKVISDVDQVWISFQHPEYVGLLMDWNVGMDNPRITTCGQ